MRLCRSLNKILLASVFILALALPVQGQELTGGKITGLELIENTDYCGGDIPCKAVYRICEPLVYESKDLSYRFLDESMALKSLQNPKITASEKDGCYIFVVEAEKSAYTNIDHQLCIKGICDTRFAWWNATFNSKQCLEVISNTINLTDYQIALNITYDSDMQNNGADLRFYNENTTTELNYWIEEDTSINGAYFYTWVEVDNIYNDTGGNTTICVYYENQTVIEPGSNGIDTFLYFDTFDVDTSAYYTIYSGGFSGFGTGELTSTSGNDFIFANNYTSANYTMLEMRARSPDYFKLERNDVSKNYATQYHLAWLSTNAVQLNERVASSSTTHNSTTLSYAGGLYHILGFGNNNGQNLYNFIDRSLILTFTDTTPRLGGYDGMILGDPSDKLDWWFVRKFYYPEPTLYGFGAEEKNVTPIVPGTNGTFNYTCPDSLCACNEGEWTNATCSDSYTLTLINNCSLDWLEGNVTNRCQTVKTKNVNCYYGCYEGVNALGADCGQPPYIMYAIVAVIFVLGIAFISYILPKKGGRR